MPPDAPFDVGLLIEARRILPMSEDLPAMATLAMATRDRTHMLGLDTRIGQLQGYHGWVAGRPKLVDGELCDIDVKELKHMAAIRQRAMSQTRQQGEA